MNILYFAHDIGDAAIWRRVEMLRIGSASVQLVGFQRGNLTAPDGAIVLGRTYDGRFVARAAAVVRLLPVIGRRLSSLVSKAPPDVVIARNLEMLALALSFARTFPANPPVVYELLDIHRLMLRQDSIGRLLRGIEARLLRRTEQIHVSSPGFIKNYLRVYHQDLPETLLLENKPLPTRETKNANLRLDPISPGQVSIGWFGILRCSWSLYVLDSITRAAPGRYRVILRGRPARDVLVDFDEVVDANPDIEFFGAYAWPDDLPAIYTDCDLAWLIDRFDKGLNSDWLLPNRLYEGARFSAVPVVLTGTQVADYVRSMGFGVQVCSADGPSVTAALSTLTDNDIAAERKKLTDIPNSVWEAGTEDCTRLIGHLQNARKRTVKGAPEMTKQQEGQRS